MENCALSWYAGCSSINHISAFSFDSYLHPMVIYFKRTVCTTTHGTKNDNDNNYVFYKVHDVYDNVC